MSLAIQAFWTLLGEDQRINAIQLAREGETLALALGAPVFARSAMTLSPTSSAGDVGAWGDLYEAATASGRGMPLSVLWSGISSLDMLRADPIVAALAGTIPSAPGWDQVRERLRTAPEPVRRVADWFASRAVSQTGQTSWWEGFLTYSDELMRLHEGLVRAWWWRYAQTLPTVAAATVTAQQQQQQATPGLGAPLPVIPSAMGTPVAQQGSDIGLGEIILAALLFWALGR